MTDAELLRALAVWFVHRPGTMVLGLEREVSTADVRDDLRRIADALATAAGQRELLATAEAERDRIAQMYGDARKDLSAAERERADTIARANLALAKAGDEAGRLREERDELYAVVGRITIAEWRARHEADE